MQTRVLLLLGVLGLSAGVISIAEAQNVPAYVTAAVNDTNRPADKALARPNDPHTARAHEQDDQFMFRFRKPK